MASDGGENGTALDGFGRRSIVYLCPSSNLPIGGIKVILRHSEIIERLGVAGTGSSVLFPENLGFDVDWFAHAAIRRRTLALDRTSDFVVVPEFWAPVFGEQLVEAGVRFGIFVQNGYQLTKLADLDGLERLKRVYDAASVILTISEDARNAVGASFPAAVPRIVDVQYSIDDTLFDRGGTKENLITYMPRKLSHHAEILVKRLMLGGLEGWTIVPIEGMSEAQVAGCLKRSRIFLSFSELEGLPVPPLEAALSGNVVVGYTGEGGKEYWLDGVFTEIAAGDLGAFAERVRDKMRQFACVQGYPDSDPTYVANVERLRRRFSAAEEERKLRAFVEAVDGLFGHVPRRSRRPPNSIEAPRRRETKAAPG